MADLLQRLDRRAASGQPQEAPSRRRAAIRRRQAEPGCGVDAALGQLERLLRLAAAAASRTAGCATPWPRQPGLGAGRRGGSGQRHGLAATADRRQQAIRRRRCRAGIARRRPAPRASSGRRWRRSRSSARPDGRRRPCLGRAPTSSSRSRSRRAPLRRGSPCSASSCRLSPPSSPSPPPAPSPAIRAAPRERGRADRDANARRRRLAARRRRPHGRSTERHRSVALAQPGLRRAPAPARTGRRRSAPRMQERMRLRASRAFAAAAPRARQLATCRASVARPAHRDRLSAPAASTCRRTSPCRVAASMRTIRAGASRIRAR